jgi:hypothetical protein
VVDLASSIQDLGLAGMLILVSVVAVIGSAKGWFVFGWIYRQEREARITAETQAVRNAESLAKASEAYVELSKSYDELAKVYADLRRTVAANDRLRRRTEQVDGPR